MRRRDRPDLRARWSAILPLLAVAVWAGCATTPAAELYPQLTEFEGREIHEVSFPGHGPLSEDTLDAITETEPTRCRLLGFLPFCFPGTDWGRQVHRVDLGRIGQDVGRLQALYRQTGYFGTRVVPEVDREEGELHLMFRIFPGDPVLVDSLIVEGTEGILDPDSLKRTLPLQEGELFGLVDFVASADAVLEALRQRGHAYTEVLRNYAVDTLRDEATAWLVAVPGPRVVVDSILVQGLQELDRSDVTRQVTFDQSDLLRLSDLRSSQRNLYSLELVQFATVEVAPDSVQLTPEDSTNATVQVSIAEAAEHLVETAVGFGTAECFRGSVQWTDRSFMAGARKLTLTGSGSRLGAEGNTLGGSICTVPQADTFAQGLDYRFAAELSQPYFYGPSNDIAATLYAERQTEPGVYQRTAQGGRVTVRHRIRTREILTGRADFEFRETASTPVLYCVQFAVCRSQDVADLATGRWRNALSAGWIRDRGNPVLDPRSGYVLRANSMWATPLLGSEIDFLRADVEGARYFPLRPEWVLAGFVRLGSFISAAGLGRNEFIPPEERFFAGGANSVRGYRRNHLGPGIWLSDQPLGTPPDSSPTFFPTGGTSVAVASLELRFPSPFLSDYLRLGAFVDGGTVGADPLWELQSQYRITPGFGFRIRTPVGPARIDIGYNPHGAGHWPLYQFDERTQDLVRVVDGFQPDPPSFFRRFRIHVAVGQAF